LIKKDNDLVVSVIDSSNLERNLYLTIQLLELEADVIVDLNMMDLSGKNYEIDAEKMEKLLRVKVVKTIGNKGIGVEELKGAITKPEAKDSGNFRINYGKDLEREIKNIEDFIKDKINDNYPTRWFAIKLLEGDQEVLAIAKTFSQANVLEKMLIESTQKLESILENDLETEIIEKRYAFLEGLARECVLKKPTIEERLDASDRIDKVLTSKFLGIPIFFGLMWLMFQFVFKIGAYPMDWIDIGFSKLGDLISGIIPQGLVQSLLVDGIIGGVGGVIIFTPNIILLFFCIAILEDSGYMARVAFIMDKFMHKIGLHGKSFIPMLIGFGCTIPSYMGSRILENRKDRLITMHVNTFMSCGARLPVYILLAGAFFPGIEGNVIFSIYLIGIVFAILMAKLLRVTRFKGQSAPFVMELPPYRIPTFRGVLLHTWERTWLYLKKAGTIILAISIIMWILFTFPLIGENYSLDYDTEAASLEQSFEAGELTEEAYEAEITDTEARISAEKLAYSAAGRIGRFIEPLFKPLGFDWKLAIASISGIGAKEVVVSTLGTLYSIQEADEESESLKDNVSRDYSPLVGYNFMLFTLLYFPCMAGMAVFKREAGLKEMLFQIGYTLLLAWTVSFVVFQVGRIFI
jgi:ferrous iron transport protein B